jgi:hippurate hydrolase
MSRFAKSLAASAALVAASLLPAHAELDVINLKKTIETSLASDYPKLDALYKELHAHPELAFQEVKTAARLAAEMRALGFEVTEGVGRTGLVAIYKNGDGPTIMVRTELDGLPMEEKTGLDYASRDKTNWNGREVFVAHSCGHDIHMASWVGTAKTLLGLKDQWRGTLMFIAQPAEEVGAGAMAMLSCSRDFQNPISALPCTQLAPSPMAPCSIPSGPAPRVPTASTSNFAALAVTARCRRQPSTP